MKRIISWTIIIALAIIMPILENRKVSAGGHITPSAMAPAFSTQDDIVIEALGAVLIEQTTGKVLYSKNAHEALYPASTTKILTALVALENASVEDIVTVGQEVKLAPNHSTVAGLRPGGTYSMLDLLLALLLPSGNDAANAIAVYITRQTNDETLGIQQGLEKFCGLMNKKAREIGAVRSNFVNPHGYHDNNHYTTAYDLALIAREAMNNPTFRRLAKTTHAVIERPPEKPDKTDTHTPNKTNGASTHKWTNGNQLLNKANKDYYFPYATGIKTGFTTPAGHCLVSSASKNGFNLISVVLRGSKEGRWVDSRKLLEHGLNNYRFHEVLKKGDTLCSLHVNNHARDESGQLNIIAAEDYRDILNEGDIPKIQGTIVWDNDLLDHDKDTQGDMLLSAPVSKGQRLGKIVYTLDGSFIRDIELVAGRDIQENRSLNIPNINILPLSKYSSPVFAIGLIIICLVILLAVRRLRTR